MKIVNFQNDSFEMIEQNFFWRRQTNRITVRLLRMFLVLITRILAYCALQDCKSSHWLVVQILVCINCLIIIAVSNRINCHKRKHLLSIEHDRVHIIRYSCKSFYLVWMYVCVCVCVKVNTSIVWMCLSSIHVNACECWYVFFSECF